MRHLTDMRDAADMSFNKFLTPGQKDHIIREFGAPAAVQIGAAYISDEGKVMRTTNEQQ